MTRASGYYLNVFGEKGLDLFVILNEANDQPTMDEYDILYEIMEQEVYKGSSAEVIKEEIELSELNCVAYGVQVLCRNR